MIKMKKQIMTTIIMGILLISFVSAYTYLPADDKRYVTSTHLFSNTEEETFKFQSHLSYCNLTCDKSEWQSYVDADMGRYVKDKEFEIANPQLSEDIIIEEEAFKQEEYPDDTSWLVATLKKIIEKVEELIFGVKELETDNQLLKDELCKKDSSYSWCLSVGELG